MGGVFRYLEGQYFVWQTPFFLTTQVRMVSSSNPTGDVTIKDLKLGSLLMQILLFAPSMAPLDHIHMYVDNTAAQAWANRFSISTASSVGPFLL